MPSGGRDDPFPAAPAAVALLGHGFAFAAIALLALIRHQFAPNVVAGWTLLALALNTGAVSFVLAHSASVWHTATLRFAALGVAIGVASAAVWYVLAFAFDPVAALLLGPILCLIVAAAMVRGAFRLGVVPGIPGAGRCAGCGYDLRSVTASRCPECGRAAG